MLALAIDPGQTTGLATRKGGKIWTGLAYNDEDVLSFIGVVKPDVVIIERFATGGRLSAYGLKTIELVGKIEGYCKALEILYFVHSPGMRKAFQSEADKLVRQDKENTSRVVHQKDALAHLLAWEYRQRRKEPQRTPSAG